MRIFNNLTVGQRTLTCIGLMIGLLVIICLFWRASVHDLGGSLDEAVNLTAKKLRLAGDLRTEFKTMLADARGAQFSLVILLLQEKDAKGKEDSTSAGCAMCHSREMQEGGHRRFTDGGGRLRRELAALRETNPSEAERELLDSISRDVEEWLTLYNAYLGMAEADRYDEAHNVMTGKIAPLLGRADQAVESLMDAQRDALARAAASVDGTIGRNRLRAAILIGVGLLLGGFVFFTVRAMNQSLRGVTAEVERGTASVAEAARQSAAASAALAQGASEQASSLSEAAAAGTDIGKVARNNEQGAQEASTMAERSERESGQARELLSSTRAAMRQAEAASAKMATILRVIDEIAFQTNILALNAAVEAARAGEAGLGFAVVADEVRTLARRCAEAAQQISGLVSDASAKNRETSLGLGRFDEALNRLTGANAGLRTLLAGVATGSRNQHRDVEQLNGSLRRMDEVTQANAGVAEESAAAAAHLEQQAATLGSAALVLSRLVGGAQSR